MSYNDYMYAVDRSDEYLAHYGIKGMKWGVQKALQSGNDRKLARQYKKAQKKLAKLERRAANGSKYAKRAARLGAGAALAGGAAVAGTEGISRGLTALQGASNSISNAGLRLKSAGGKRGGRLGAAMTAAGEGMKQAGRVGSTGLMNASGAVKNWGAGNNLAMGAANKFTKVQNSLLGKPKNLSDLANNVKTASDNALRNTNAVKGITNNTIARVGAGALGAGLAGAAAYNAYRAATTKKAAAKAQQFRSEMNKAFAGTQYANGGNGSSGGSKKRRRH